MDLGEKFFKSFSRVNQLRIFSKLLISVFTKFWNGKKCSNKVLDVQS